MPDLTDEQQKIIAAWEALKAVSNFGKITFVLEAGRLFEIQPQPKIRLPKKEELYP